MRRGWTAFGLMVGMLAGACVDLLPYQCTDDDDCLSTMAEGWCEDSQFCSYPDPECDSGRRFSDLAGNLKNMCTGVASGGSTGAQTTSSSDGETGSTSPPDGSSSDNGTSSTGPADPLCGNGEIEQGEECDDPDTNGCSTDNCVVSGEVRWSAIVSGAAGRNDRYFGLTQLDSGGVATVGYIEEEMDDRDVLLSIWELNGTSEGVESRFVYDLDGMPMGTDEAEAVVQGDDGELYVCGRATMGGTGPWVARWNFPYDQAPLFSERIPGVLGICHDIKFVASNYVVAVGGGTSSNDPVMGTDTDTAWIYSMSDSMAPDGISMSTSVISSRATQTAFKSVVLGSKNAVYVAGQVNDEAVVYESSAMAMMLGDPIFMSEALAQPQSMLVGTGDVFILAGLAPVTETNLWIEAFSFSDLESIWAYGPDTVLTDEIEDIAFDPAGNLYAIGHVQRDENNSDRWIGKLDTEGALVWSRSDFEFSELGHDRGRSIEVLPNGDLMVVGEVTTERGGYLDGWIAQLSP